MTSSSSSITNHDYSIVMLSSDSEDELPSLSQRIGLSKGTNNPVNINGSVIEKAVVQAERKLSDGKAMEHGVASDEISTASNMTSATALLNKQSISITTAVIVTAHDDTVSMSTAPTVSHKIGANKDEVVTIDDDNSSPPTMDHQLLGSSTTTSISANKQVYFICCHLMRCHNYN